MNLVKSLLEMRDGPRVFNAIDFNFKNNQFTAFASDLGKGRNFSGPIYNDAADDGFFIKSTKTGKLACYALDEPTTDGEGDIQYWEAKPVRKHHSLFNYDQIADFDTYSKTKVVIFNT